jgi:allophanate hydrolase subunit 2
LWHYLAIRGGIQVDQVLGSSSRDTLSRLGPPACQRGDRLEIGSEPSLPVVADVAPLPGVTDVIRVTPGPRADWFPDEWPRLLAAASWTVTTSSRVGVRLHGAQLGRTVSDELPSEGLVRGALQVPPDGDPVMMLADHPTTGGYPVIAVVHPDDVAVVAQHAAGTSVRLRLVDAG